MPHFLVSPAEPPLIKTLGPTSAAVERHGADILWVEPAVGGAVGVQRKTVTDLLSSVEDGRLEREIPQLLSQCRARFLIIEGRAHWTSAGMFDHKWLGHWSRTAYRSLLRSIQLKGIIIEFSDNEADTVVAVEGIAKWVAKGDHTSLMRRNKPGPDRWGTRSNRATQLHLLQGLDGLGPKQAELILDSFGGLPWQWTVTAEQLKQIKGIGPKTLDILTRIIPPARSSSALSCPDCGADYDKPCPGTVRNAAACDWKQRPVEKSSH